MSRLKRPFTFYLALAYFATLFWIERTLIRWGVLKGWEDEDYSDFGI